VKLNDRPVARFDLEAKPEGSEAMSCVVTLIQTNVYKLRQFHRRRQDGLNYKDIKFPRIQLVVVDPDGKVVFQKMACKYTVSGEIKVTSNATYKVYASAADGKGNNFTLRVYTKDGAASLTEVPEAQIKEITAALANS